MGIQAVQTVNPHIRSASNQNISARYNVLSIYIQCCPIIYDKSCLRIRFYIWFRAGSRKISANRSGINVTINRCRTGATIDLYFVVCDQRIIQILRMCTGLHLRQVHTNICRDRCLIVSLCLYNRQILQ